MKEYNMAENRSMWHMKIKRRRPKGDETSDRLYNVHHTYPRKVAHGSSSGRVLSIVYFLGTL